MISQYVLSQFPCGNAEYPASSEKYFFKLPGEGVPGDDCDKDVGMICTECGHRWVGKSSCMMRECPNCCEKWAIKLAATSSHRVWAGANLVYKNPYRLLHCVVSFERLDNIEDERELARRVLKKHGLDGGLMIIHHKEPGMVHFHAISVAQSDVSPGGSDTFRGRNIVFKVVPDKRYGDFRGFRRMKDVRRCIRYLLSHASIIEGRHCLTWYGKLSYNLLATGTLKELYPEAYKKRDAQCPRCCQYAGVQIEQWDWTGGYPIPINFTYDLQPLYCGDCMQREKHCGLKIETEMACDNYIPKRMKK